MITDQQVEAARSAFHDAINATMECSKCKGVGYHHGFGENGHDPDWCLVCGGAGFIEANTEAQAMRAALEAAFASPTVGQDASAVKGEQ